MDQQQICNVAAQAFLLVCGGAFGLLVVTWRLFLTNRYLKEALDRELRSSTARERLLLNDSSRRSSNITRSLLESFLREPVPSLKDLVERTEHEYRLRASARQSAEDEQTQELETRDFTQL